MSDVNIEEKDFRDKELEALEPLSPEEEKELRYQDLQGDIDMDAKYQE